MISVVASAIGSAVFGFIRQAPSWLLVAVGIVLYYEGIPPVPVSVPFFGEVSLWPGRVDAVRNAADARCRQMMDESRRAAEYVDSQISRRAAQERAEQVERFTNITMAAQREASDYARELERERAKEDEEASQAGRSVCRSGFSGNDRRRLSRESLPYPGAQPVPNN